jgi:Reverse transcriptase (RNA-dependent DNA polymerase)
VPTLLLQGDPRLGTFDAIPDQGPKHLDRNALKSLGALPAKAPRAAATLPESSPVQEASPVTAASPHQRRPQPRKPADQPLTPKTRSGGGGDPSSAVSQEVGTAGHFPDTPVPHSGTSTVPSPASCNKSGAVDPDALRPRDVWDPHVSLRYLTRHLPGAQTDAKAVWQQPYVDNPVQHGLYSDAQGTWQQEDPDAALGSESVFSATPAVSDDPNPHSILITITEASLQTVTPRNATEALRSPLRKMWLLAMQREKDCHVKNGTFGREMEPQGRQPPDSKPIPADWIFKIKHRGGPVEVSKLDERQFKARVVIRGQFMKEGIDFNDTFAPVAKPATVRALLAFAAANAYKLKVGDIETAFLTATMDCEVWVRMPPFWGDKVGPVNPQAASCSPRLLLKGVPGIPQGSRLFHQTFATYLASIGFKPSDADRCLFFKLNSTERFAVLLWVDDFIIMHESDPAFDSFISMLRKKFTVPSIGPLKCFLGMEVFYYPSVKEMYVNQAHTATVLLERAGMLECNPTSTPCPAGAVFTKADCPPDAATNTTTSVYRSLIALANFLSCWTRPDITFAVNKLCKFMSNPGEVHWKLLKHLLRYIKGTVNLGLFYHAKSPPCKLLGYTDSSYADCPDTGRSTLAYAFFYGQSVLSWYSKLNTFVTTCTNHSEYAALALGAKEAEWLVLLMLQLDPANPQVPVPIFVDNAGIVSMVFNPVDHQANKHVKISCHYTRELAELKVIIPVRVPTELNTADVFTKPLQSQQFKNLTSTLMRELSTDAAAPVPLAAASPLIKREHTATVAIALQSAPAAQAVKREHVFMLQENDEEDEGDSECDAGEPSPPPDESKSDFQKNWPYPSALKQVLGASSYTVHDTNQKFSTGRDKLEVVFFRTDQSGAKVELSRHDGMSLESRQGRRYIVCSKYPKPPQRAKPPSSIINLVAPVPCLTCVKCGMINTQAFSLLECASCNGFSFNWSCACVQHADLKHPSVPDVFSPSPAPLPLPLHAIGAPASPATPATPPRRSRVPAAQRRLPSLSLSVATPTAGPPPTLQGVPSPVRRPARQPTGKTWTKQIKYVGPLGRFTEYHEMECPVTAGSSSTLTATIEFANAYNLKPAPCCH